MFAQSLAHFAIRLILGISLMLSLAPRRDITSGFFRIQMLLILGLAVLFGLTREDLPVGPIAIALLAFVGSVLWTLERRTGGTIALVLATLISFVELALCARRILGTESDGGFLPYFLSDLATAGTLGGAMTGMLLGHWYLTAPGMPLTPLLRMNTQFGVASACRLAFSAVALFQARGDISGEMYWTWVGLRWLAGVAGPIAVWFMVRQILKYRNTQAATGVLFVGVILTFIGELTADLLFRELHKPL